MDTKSLTQVFGPADARHLAPRAAEHQAEPGRPDWEIREHTRGDGGITMCAYVGDDPVWVAYELLEPVGQYRWQIFHFRDHGFPVALVWDAAAARKWLERMAQHELLAAKAVTA
ncbi:hypothetical protein E2F47_22690 [Mycobacterium eburneum]|nr:hypothetical protein [Mycobacterium eburneum]TDH48707.1 hypothetical protein E2F47_22690 [Mycobacterium eburneum]